MPVEVCSLQLLELTANTRVTRNRRRFPVNVGHQTEGLLDIQQSDKLADQITAL